MFNKILSLFAVIFISSCAGGYENYKACPRVNISRSNAYLTQVVNYKEQFRISLIGFEGFCYQEKSANQSMARIIPVFEIQRLRPSDETTVHFAYYTETVKGPPEYLGKKTYYEEARIPLSEQKTEYRGHYVNVRIPPEMKYSFDIYLGMVISPEEYKYNQRTFDINYKYSNN